MSDVPATPPAIKQLRHALQRPLPGADAHREAWPADLPPRTQQSPAPPSREAAVLLALFEETTTGRWQLPMIRRTPQMRHHARQIGFPGGATSQDETPEECAVREAEEEIGIDIQGVEILGRLTRVEIPVSGFSVEPVVAWMHTPPQTWCLQEGEVDALVLVDIEHFVRDGFKTQHVRERDGAQWKVPAFDAEGERIWGASALILAELRRIWPSPQQIRSS